MVYSGSLPTVQICSRVEEWLLSPPLVSGQCEEASASIHLFYGLALVFHAHGSRGLLI